MNKIIKCFDPEKPSGFTLMELMIVIGIIGIMAAISIPMLRNPEHRASKAARELMGDMQKTRISAIKNNQTWAIVFVPANNNYLICSDPGPDPSPSVKATWYTTADNTIVKTISFTDYAAGIRYGNGTATTNATSAGGTFPVDFVSYPPYNVLTFKPQGTCGAGYVYLFYGNASYAIGTLETGIVRIKRWTGGAWR